MSDLTGQTAASGDFKQYVAPIISLYLASAFFEPLVFDYLVSSIDCENPAQCKGTTFKIFNTIYLVFPILVMMLIILFNSNRINVSFRISRLKIKVSIFYILIILTVVFLIVNLLTFNSLVSRTVLIWLAGGISLCSLILCIVLIGLAFSSWKKAEKSAKNWFQVLLNKYYTLLIVSFVIVLFGSVFIVNTMKGLNGQASTTYDTTFDAWVKYLEEKGTYKKLNSQIDPLKFALNKAKIQAKHEAESKLPPALEKVITITENTKDKN